ncbi:MAG: hypothetical protein WA885_15695 [Phormidesmis sp.]
MFGKISFTKQGILGAVGLALLSAGVQLPVSAQAIEETMPTETVSTEAVSTETVSTEAVLTETASTENSYSAEALMPADAESMTVQPVAEGAETVTYPVEGSTELAQARRRTRNTVLGSDFIGIGADFGYADDVSFAVISKLSLNEQIAVRPSVLVGDGFSVLVPVTYEFNRFSTDVGGFQLRPYAGVGASYVDDDNDENFNLLVAAGADVPLSQQFTLNAQANLGLFNDTDFGVTVGVGYNFGRAFR